MKNLSFLAGPATSSYAEPNYRLIIIEDTAEDLDRIKIELAKFGVDKPDEATNYKAFRKLLGHSLYDAVSIDWELQRAEKGREILKLLAQQHPEVVKVVYTRHDERRGEALALGADAFLVKGDDVDLSQYSAVMKKAARRGCLNHIHKRLSVLGHKGLPSLPRNTVEVDEETEKIILESARQVLVQEKIDEQEDELLRELLIRRGRWCPMEFNITSYVRLSWRNKIKKLLAYTGISAGEVTAILETEETRLKAFFDEEGGGEIVGQNLLESLDHLLSILGYLLRLSNYDPELMNYFWRIKDFYKYSLEKPPWDEVGLATYLREQGQQGLSKSLIWIRSH